MKLLSLNIEGKKHLELVLPFIIKEQPDVLCIQEILEESIPLFEAKLGMKAIYAPMAYDLITHEGGLACVALFTKQAVQNPLIEYYSGSREKITTLPHTEFNLDTVHTFIQNAVVAVTMEIEGKAFTIATTHGTWTPNGTSTDYQLEDFDRMMGILDSLGEFIFVGDLNAPRGEETFSRLAKKYKDNIPQEYITSLDKTFHRNPAINKMVDGLFTTPKYTATNVRLVGGVSDHCAVIADIL